jgi:pimeloyl-ACP methyl ester carboxylesterase
MTAFAATRVSVRLDQRQCTLELRKTNATANSDFAYVFLHGIGAGSSGWQSALQAAQARGFNALAWEAPGYGHSTPLPASEPSAAEYALSLWALLDHLQLKSVHLVGHSMGAVIASATAAMQPESIAAITLLAPARGYRNAPQAIRSKTLADRINAAESLGMAALAMQRSFALLAPNAAPEALQRTQTDLAAVPLAGYVQGAHLLANADLIPDLQAWRVRSSAPLTVACGELDAITPMSGCEKLADALNAPFVSLGAIGHMCTLEAADKVNQLLGLA